MSALKYNSGKFLAEKTYTTYIYTTVFPPVFNLYFFSFVGYLKFISKYLLILTALQFCF